MPWFAWIGIVAIVMFTVVQIVSMKTGRAIPGSESDSAELEALRRRIDELEGRPAELEEPRVPSKSEENLAAEDRWRLDLLEARLEELEKRRRDHDRGESAH